MNPIDALVNFINPEAGARRLYFRNIKDIEKAYFRQLRMTNTQDTMPAGNSTDFSEMSECDYKGQRTLMRKRFRESDLVKSIVNGLADHVVGPNGPTLQMKTADKVYNKDIEEWWNETKDTLDSRGLFTFADICHTAERDKHLVGDLGFIKNNALKKLQGIESEQIDSPADKRLTDKVYWGVKYSSLTGSPELFYIGEYDPTSAYVKNHKEIAAKDFIFYANLDRFSSPRGISSLFTSMSNIQDLEGYLEAEKSRTRLASLFGLKFTKNLNSAPGSFLGLDTKTGDTNKAGTTLPQLKVGKLTNVQLNPGEDVGFIESNAPSSQFGSFISVISRLIGLGAGPIPLEFVLLDFSNGNFTSIRAAWLAAKNTYLRNQAKHRVFVNNIFSWRYKLAVRDNEIEAAPGGILVPRHNFIYPVYEYINPREEIAAQGDALDRCLTTLAAECAKSGEDYEEIIEQRAKEIAMMKEKGIPVVVSKPGSNVSGTETDKK